MRAVARQLGLWSLIAVYAVLWTGGSAWHGLTCCHHHRSGSADESQSVCKSAPHTGCHGHHSHDHGSEPVHSHESPLPGGHDENDCQICHWFAQAQALAALPLPLLSGELLAGTYQLPGPSHVQQFVARYLSRGPPCRLRVGYRALHNDESFKLAAHVKCAAKLRSAAQH